ncbi:hypothetical protein FMN52_02280 [Marinobacter sp. BW6]|uniref:hypothetical protein n=1 Tax=Marinobacter sp. BW6 TaxID=2592624 RepID=UPI0011DECF09|nr:hypothetical protein [Marinobacter sp. BW6]TYC62604.1 hypothetical protein FMN52_02280 [Marinobacter sp. BW6]
MTDLQNIQTPGTSSAERRDRKFSVSANRGKASHKVRYVEAGGAAVDADECTFCQSVPDLSVDTWEKGKDRSN